VGDVDEELTYLQTIIIPMFNPVRIR